MVFIPIANYFTMDPGGKKRGPVSLIRLGDDYARAWCDSLPLIDVLMLLQGSFNYPLITGREEKMIAANPDLSKGKRDELYAHVLEWRASKRREYVIKRIGGGE